MLTTGVDPFTQIYQAVMNQLMVYPGLQTGTVPGGGTGLFRTILDMSSPSFQTLMRMGSGDTPALRISGNLAEWKIAGRNSLISDFEYDVICMVTEDTLNIVPVDECMFMLICSMAKLPMDMGLTGLVRCFRPFQSMNRMYQAAKPKSDGEVDAAGSLRWSYVVSFRVEGYLSAVALQSLYPTVVQGT